MCACTRWLLTVGRKKDVIMDVTDKVGGRQKHPWKEFWLYNQPNNAGVHILASCLFAVQKALQRNKTANIYMIVLSQ